MYFVVSANSKEQTRLVVKGVPFADLQVAQLLTQTDCNFFSARPSLGCVFASIPAFGPKVLK